MANTPLAFLSSFDIPLQSLDSTVSILVSEISMSNSEQPNIVNISTVAFLCVSKLLGSSNFKLCLYSLNIQVHSAKLAETSNLSNVSSEYYKFTNIFSENKAEVLTPHYPYDLKINLEEGAQPPVGPIYSLLVSE